MGKGIVKLGEGDWAVKDGNLLAAKETNGRFKNAEFTVTRGTRATYVGRDGLIKESNLQNTNLVPSIITTENNNGGVINYISSNIYSSTSDGTSTSIIRPKFDFNTTSGKTYKLVITPTGAITGTVNFDFHDGSSYLFQDYDFTTTKEIYFTDNGNVFGSFDGQQTYSIDSFTISVKEIKTDTPRIDFTDNTDGHLLLEPQSANLLPHSEDFSSSNWSHLVSASIDPNVVISPDGTQNASRLNFHQGSTTSRIEKQIIGQTTGSYTFSVWAKSATNENVQFEMEIGSAGTGAVAKTATSDWQRFEITGSVSSGTVNLYPQIESYTSTNPSIYIWGAQFEKLSYPTSYIPTNGSTVTRDADTCTGAGEAIDFNSEEGVLYAEISALADDGIKKYISLSDGSTNNDVRLYFDTNGYISALSKVGGSTQVFIQSNAYTQTDFNKVAFKYKVNDFALWINGTEVATDDSGSVNSVNALNQLNFNGNNLDFFGKCKAIRVYKEALSDTDLQNLTS